MNHCKRNYIIVTIFLFLILFFIIGLLVGNRRLLSTRYHNDKISFYYRDTLFLDSVFYQYSDYSIQLAKGNHVTLNDRRLFFTNPEEIDTTDIKIDIQFSKGDKTIRKTIYSRCWIDGEYRFVENTKHSIWKGSTFKHVFDVIENITDKHSKKTVVSLGDTLFSSLKGHLYLKCAVGEYKCGDIVLESVEYNQMIRGGKYQFLRTNNKLYVSSDNFKSFKLVYDDRRGIKESMYWDEMNERLIYSMYTPGSIRLRHYLISYDPETDFSDTIQTFYTSDDNKHKGLTPYCRHIHLICKDPFTGDMYVGVGDYDEEPAIYRSQDGGKTIECIGGKKQIWRTLSFFFTEDYIFWTTDSESPQYINRISRNQLGSLPINESEITRFPLFNSALWCNLKIDDNFFILGSNSEGQFYDDYHRTYALKISKDGIPTVYNLLEEKSLPEKNGKIIYHQVFPLCVDYSGQIWCFDNHLGIRTFSLNRNN